MTASRLVIPLVIQHEVVRSTLAPAVFAAFSKKDCRTEIMWMRKSSACVGLPNC